MLTFRHQAKRHGCFRGISIPLCAVNTLKEFDSIITQDPNPFRMPLDKKVWIEHKYDMVKLFVLSSRHEGVDYRFFRFNSHVWKDFIKHIYPKIISFMKNGDRHAGDHRESHAHDKSNGTIESYRHRVAHSRKRQGSPCWKTSEISDKSPKRSSDNVNMESEEDGETVDYPLLS